MILSNQLIEASRPPFAVEDLGGRFGYGLAGHCRLVSIVVISPNDSIYQALMLSLFNAACSRDCISSVS